MFKVGDNSWPSHAASGQRCASFTRACAPSLAHLFLSVLHQSYGSMVRVSASEKATNYSILFIQRSVLSLK